MTPIMSAAEHNRVEALEVLLTWEGVRVDHVDKVCVCLCVECVCLSVCECVCVSECVCECVCL